MNARRATWILLGVVIVVGLGFVEVATRVTVHRRDLLDPSEETYWLHTLANSNKITMAGEDVIHHPKLGWRMRPNFESNGARVNAQSMRSVKEYPVERTPGVRRIVTIGDSYTYGLGVADEDTFSAIVDDALADTEVLNAGTNGWGTDQSFIDYQLHRHQYDPDVIIVGIYEDDYNRNGVRAREYLKPKFEVRGDELVLTNVPIPRPSNFAPSSIDVPGSLRIFELGQFAYRKFRWKTSRKWQSDASFEERSDILRFMLRDLKKLAETGRKRHVMVMTWPTIFYEASWDSARIRQRVVRIAEEVGVKAYDLTPALEARAAKDGKPVYDAKSSHWTRAGHEVAAAQIIEHLRSAGLAP